MNRAETAEAAKVMQHYAEGGYVDLQRLTGQDMSWDESNDPGWNLEYFRYRPRKRSGESWAYINDLGVMTPTGIKPIHSKAFRIKWEEVSESG